MDIIKKRKADEENLKKYCAFGRIIWWHHFMQHFSLDHP